MVPEPLCLEGQPKLFEAKRLVHLSEVSIKIYFYCGSLTLRDQFQFSFKHCVNTSLYTSVHRCILQTKNLALVKHVCDKYLLRRQHTKISGGGGELPLFIQDGIGRHEKRDLSLHHREM